MESKKIQYLQGVSQLFDTAWDTYKNHFKNLIKINTIPALIAVITGLVFKFAEQVSNTTDVTFFSGIQIVTLVLSVVLVSVVAGSLSYVAQVMLLNENVYVSIKDSFSKSIPYLYTYIFVMILMALSVFFGALLLIVPGIIFAIWFMFAPLSLVVTGNKGLSALRTSKKLVYGIWGPVFFRVIALMALSLLLSIAASVFTDFIQKLFSVSELSVETVIDFVYQLIVTPFGIVYIYELYKNIVEADKKASPVHESLSSTGASQSTTS